MSTDTPTSATSPPRGDTEMHDDEDTEMIDADQDEEEEDVKPELNAESSTTEDLRPQREPREHRKDKDLNTFLNQMDKYAPIVWRLVVRSHFLDPRCRHGILSFVSGIRMLR